MDLHVFSICFNEELMLPYFIQHYKKLGAKKITIYDNFSTDLSRQIIRESGCELIDYDSKEQIRDDLYLSIKNNCWKKTDTEWVIVVDIDELLEPPVFDLDNCTIVNTKGYDIAGLPPSRLGVANELYNKRCMFRPSEIKEINFAPGCHSAKPVGNVVGSDKFANLLHYRYISEEYNYNRYLLYQSRLSEINKKYGWGLQYSQVEREKIHQQFQTVLANAKKLTR